MNWQRWFHSLELVLYDDGAQGDNLGFLGPWVCEAQVFFGTRLLPAGLFSEEVLWQELFRQIEAVSSLK